MDGALRGQAGIGLRTPLAQAIAARRPDFGFLEVHAENLMDDAPALDTALALRRDYPLSLHAVGLSLGATEPPSAEHLGRFAGLIARLEPALVSDHLAWCGWGEAFLNDLLPLPYTEEALGHVVENVAIAQEALGRRLLIENPSTYLQFAQSTIPEPEFLVELVRRTGCGLLLDINNIAVSAFNHGWDARAYLAAIPAAAVGEFHVAGHVEEDCGGHPLRIDTHSRPVTEEVWSLLAAAVDRHGVAPVLVEWDKDIPPIEVMLAEWQRARQVLHDGARTQRAGHAVA